MHSVKEKVTQRLIKNGKADYSGGLPWDFVVLEREIEYNKGKWKFIAKGVGWAQWVENY